MEVSDIVYSYGIFVFSIILVVYIVYLQFNVNKSTLRQWCMLILTCALISNISVLFQIVNITNENTWIWYKAFGNIGESLLPTCVFFAILYFTNSNFKFKPKYLLLFVIPILSTIFMFTNNYHHLVFKTFSIEINNCEYGILFYVHFANVVITYLLALTILLKYLLENYKKYHLQILIGLIFGALPYIFNVLALLKVFSFKVYITEIFQSIMSVNIILIALKYSILIEFPISLKSILDTVTNAFIVIDENKNIVTYNMVFLNTYNLGKLNIKRMEIGELIQFKEFDTIFDNDIDRILKLPNSDENIKIEFERNSKVLDRTLRYECEYLDIIKKKKLYLILVTDLTQYSKNVQSIKLNHDAILRKRTFGFTSVK